MSERDRDVPGDAPLDLSPWAAPTPPRGLTNRVMDAVRAGADTTSELVLDETRARRAHVPGAQRWRGVAAGLAAALGAAALTWALWPRSPVSAPVSGHVVAAAPSKVELGGGTVALLSAGADLSWLRDGGGLAVTQNAGSVTYQHPGPSSLIVSTPAAVVHTASASMHVEVPMPVNKPVIAGVAGAAVAAAVVIAVYEGRAEVRQPTVAPKIVEAGGQVAVALPSAPKPSFTPVGKAVKDRAQRDALAAAIASARAARTSGVAGGGTGNGSGPAGAALTTGPGAPAAKVDLTPGELSKDEIRDGVREVIPLLTDCYVLMLDKHPRIGGRVMAKLVVEAEPDIGTIITMEDDSQLDMRGAVEGTDVRALQTDLNDFSQCLTATLESVALPPLGDKDGGRIEINYPFVFAPSEEETDDYGSTEPPKPPGPTQRKAPPPEPGPDAALTSSELLAEAEAAARTSQWAKALLRSEQAIRRVDATQNVPRAAMVAALAACNLKKPAKAKTYFARATPSSRTLIRQRCLIQGIKVDTQAEAEAEPDLKDPFGTRGAGTGSPTTPQRDDGVMDPFKRR